MYIQTYDINDGLIPLIRASPASCNMVYTAVNMSLSQYTRSDITVALSYHTQFRFAKDGSSNFWRLWVLI